MYRLGLWIAKHRIAVLIFAVILLIPAVLGYLMLHVNYDILYYLPDDIETMQGQQILLDDFGKGAYAMFVAEDMPDSQVAALKAEIEQVDHVADVIWYDSVMDISVPAEILPEKLYNAFHTDNATLMAIFFDTGSSSDETMDAIDTIRNIAGEKCFLSSISAIVTDTKHLVEQELFWYVLIAVVCSAVVLAATMDSWMAPVLFLLNIGMAIVYNLGTNFIQGEISFITMSLAAVLQLAVTMDYSIFLWNAYREQRGYTEDREDAMAKAIVQTASSASGSSLSCSSGSSARISRSSRVSSFGFTPVLPSARTLLHQREACSFRSRRVSSFTAPITGSAEKPYSSARAVMRARTSSFSSRITLSLTGAPASPIAGAIACCPAKHMQNRISVPVIRKARNHAKNFFMIPPSP